jgi:regulator of nucleoside diphosphate kinase
MNNDRNPVVLCEEDFSKLKQIVNMHGTAEANEMTLAYEVGRAIVVKDDAFPPNTVRLGSKVKVEDVQTAKSHEFMIVMPEDADIKEKKVSVLTPMAAAIIGFREGEEAVWKMPAGLKQLKVLEVVNKPAFV